MDKIFASGQNIAVIASYPNNLAKATSLCLVLRTSKLWTALLSISISLCHNAASFSIPISNIFISQIFSLFSFFHFKNAHVPFSTFSISKTLICRLICSDRQLDSGANSSDSPGARLYLEQNLIFWTFSLDPSPIIALSCQSVTHSVSNTFIKFCSNCWICHCCKMDLSKLINGRL